MHSHHGVLGFGFENVKNPHYVWMFDYRTKLDFKTAISHMQMTDCDLCRLLGHERDVTAPPVTMEHHLVVPVRNNSKG